MFKNAKGLSKDYFEWRLFMLESLDFDEDAFNEFVLPLLYEHEDSEPDEFGYFNYFEYQTNVEWDEFSSERDYYSQDPRKEIDKEFWAECEEIPF